MGDLFYFGFFFGVFFGSAAWTCPASRTPQRPSGCGHAAGRGGPREAHSRSLKAMPAFPPREGKLGPRCHRTSQGRVPSLRSGQRGRAGAAARACRVGAAGTGSLPSAPLPPPARHVTAARGMRAAAAGLNGPNRP